MYEQTFQFSSRPFNSVPRLEDFFASLSHQQAMEVAKMCVDRSTGPVVVVGSVGMGKSLLLQKLRQSFEGRFDVVHIECSRLEQRSELLQSILFELNLPYSGLTEGELRLSLMGYLKENKGADDGVLLLVDEADRLSVELIDELRLMANQIRDDRSLVQLVLAGTQRLEESLADAKLTSFNQRIAARCVLQNLSKAETQQFIYQHVERAGRAGDEIFDEEAIDEIYQNTDGCPRLINQLCDQSLLLAASHERQPVDRPLIREAWAEMQNMPLAPADDGAADVSDSGFVVEFGQLGDHAASTEIEDANADGAEEDPFVSQCSGEADEGAACHSEEAAANDEQGHDDEGNETSNEVADEEATGTTDANSGGIGPAGIHATAAGLAASAFAATAFSSDPFALHEEPQLEDGNTESERIASLEQEQDDLLEQTRGSDEAASDSNDIRSAFGQLGLGEQDADPSYVDDMIPADPFRLPNDPEDSSDSDEEIYETDAVQEIAEASDYDSDVEVSSSPMAQCSIEEQLGLVEPAAAEAASFHTPAFEPGDPGESDSFQNQMLESSQEEGVDSFDLAAESTDPFAESFEEEEMLQDAYSPFVAEQNQASLEVTSSQLTHLTPLDEKIDAEAEAVANDWDSQTPELAIEELDELGISGNEAPVNEQANDDDDRADNATLQSDHHEAAQTSDSDWQADPETAWDPSQFKVPPEVTSETPASFNPVPSVRTEIPSVSNLSEAVTDEASAVIEDPLTPQVEQQAEQEGSDSAQEDTEKNVDADLEALTSDLDAASTFELAGQQTDGEEETPEPAVGPGTGMMDLNDLFLGHKLQQMEAGRLDQDDYSRDDGSDTTGQSESFGFADGGYAAPAPTAGFAVPYSTHASVEDSVTPEAAAQAEARRKTEEFMRNFNAQRDSDVSGEAEQPTPTEPPTSDDQPSAVEQPSSVEQATSDEQPTSVEQPSSVDQHAAVEGGARHREEQSQEILKEIFSQQQLLDGVHYTDPAPAADHQSSTSSSQSESGESRENEHSVDGLGADSVSVESPVTEYKNYQQPGEPPATPDDRDMLYVNETEHYTPPQADEPPQPPPFPNVETSTGNAQRIDYNQLFEQLRNQTPET